MEPIMQILVGLLAFMCGAIVGLGLAWITSERKEKFIRRLINHGCETLHNSLLSVAHLQKQYSEARQIEKSGRLEKQIANDRAYAEQMFYKHEELRKAADDADRLRKEEERNVVYQLPPPPEWVIDSFCPEDWLMAFEQASGNKRIDVKSALPWLRGAMASGYGQGKHIAIAQVAAAAQKKGKRK